MKFTPFESEILDSILWQIEGFKIGRVSRRASTRILRATIRRIRPRLVARSEATNDTDREIDHAIPVHVLCERLLSITSLDRPQLERIIGEWLVTVELTMSEHREVLKKCGLHKCMPNDWDGCDPLARYHAAGIRLRALGSDAVDSESGR
jgi:hypothetical protein